VSLRAELWPQLGPRSVSPLFVTTRDVSVKGFYFVEEWPDLQINVGTHWNFLICFPRELTGGWAELIRGLARCVRIEVPDGGRRGLGMCIEYSQRSNGSLRA
jgi:hypothetical protein